jgi:hypothetical protein
MQQPFFVPVKALTNAKCHDFVKSFFLILGTFANAIAVQGGSIRIEGNLITSGASQGPCISIRSLTSSTIENNTMFGNSIAVEDFSSDSSTINYNNILNNGSKIFLNFGASGNINASYNWWGG